MAWLSFGRLRTLHLNLVAYGWAPMATLGTALWRMPRLLKTKLLGGRVAIAGAVLWNVGLIIGLASIARGHNDGKEWLEIPWTVGHEVVAGGAMIGLPLVMTLQRRQVERTDGAAVGKEGIDTV